VLRDFGDVLVIKEVQKHNCPIVRNDKQRDWKDDARISHDLREWLRVRDGSGKGAVLVNFAFDSTGQFTLPHPAPFWNKPLPKTPSASSGDLPLTQQTSMPTVSTRFTITGQIRQTSTSTLKFCSSKISSVTKLYVVTCLGY
jgi:hypothetical protein